MDYDHDTEENEENYKKQYDKANKYKLKTDKDYEVIEIDIDDHDHDHVELDPLHLPPLNGLENIVKSVVQCNKPLCDDADLQCVIEMVEATICEAITIVDSDPRGLFCYKIPEATFNITTRLFDLNMNALGANITSTYSETISKHYTGQWMTIGKFSYNIVIGEIREYIGRWHLSPDTRCVVLSNSRSQNIPIKGNIHFVDAHFSRPTPSCPNPLAVAKVRFLISVSNLLPKHYPVMVTYRFEGYNTLYYAVGERAINSYSFQRFFIDTILHTKLSFYAEICECRHGTVQNPKENIKSKKFQKRKSFF